MSECEIRWCRSGENATIPVNENIGDGSHLVWICRSCAKALGVGPHSDLPEPETVRRKLKGRDDAR